MLEIKYYENENKKISGYPYCCAYLETTEFYGYTNLDQLETRCATYEDAKKQLLEYVIELRDELNKFIERENR